MRPGFVWHHAPMECEVPSFMKGGDVLYRQRDRSRRNGYFYGDDVLQSFSYKVVFQDAK